MRLHNTPLRTQPCLAKPVLHANTPSQHYWLSYLIRLTQAQQLSLRNLAALGSGKLEALTVAVQILSL